MSVTPETREIESVANATFRGLRDMDALCPAGLCYYVSCSPYAGKKHKDEAAITWGVTEALGKDWRIEQKGHRYPESRKRCDRVLEFADGTRLWLEVKMAWLTWFYGLIKQNPQFMYNGYFHGDHHSHSVAGDFTKLEQIGSGHARYLALLVVGFDGQDGTMVNDMATLAERERLVERGWHLLSDSWMTRQSDECWIRCWFAWREAK